MTIAALAFLAIALLNNALCVTSESHYLNEWAAHITGGEEQAERIAKRYGYEIISKVPNFADHYVLKRNDVPHRSKRSAHHLTKRLTEDGQVPWAEQQVAKSRVKRKYKKFELRSDGSSDFNDPFFAKEWYIENSDDSNRQLRGQQVHLDLQVKQAWMKGYTGKNVTVCVLDDGIEHNNTELAENYDPYASTDLNDNDDDPFPRYDPTDENKHGTRCAGEIAMVANNNNCGVGIAYNSRIGGVRMLDGRVTDLTEAKSLSFNYTYIDIYTSSWGPNDDGVTMEGPGTLAKQALEKGVTEGRNGKGCIYMWASGNGGRLQDNCNSDGYTSSIYTLSVSSATEHGRIPWYSELCPSTMATTYSSGNTGDHRVVSADLHNRCTTSHTGTSAAAPMAAGIVALLLEANPELYWRDVQHLVALTCKVGPLSAENGWYQNAAGFCVHDAFGFGLMDANELVTAGHPNNWVMVPEKHICEIEATTLSKLPQKLTSGNLVEILIETDGCVNQENEVKYLEHVQVIFTATYSKRGAISVFLTSPSGTRTKLLSTRNLDKSSDGFNEWPLMSVHTWGENPKGVWKFQVMDTNVNGSDHGEIKDVKLVLHGTKEAPHYMKNGSLQCDVDIATTHKPKSESEPISKTVQEPYQASDINEILKLLQQRRSADAKIPEILGAKVPYLYR